jgi:regulatory protein
MPLAKNKKVTDRLCFTSTGANYLFQTHIFACYICPVQKLTPKQALLKLAKYCAYQERCHDEVRNKLAEYGVWGDDAAEIILELIEQNYLNEERFAKAYAGGKFRTKKWGRVKIMRELKQRHISDYCIKKGLLEIDDDSYTETLKQLAVEKYNTVKDKNIFIRKQKTARYLTEKGYETDLIWDLLKKMD